ncbi:hypothetical protein GTO10_05390 [Candidatus Saccharibacteria bacterium]|nr:hypothetical protein [Candidatus Saccharibacteria bacterium]
MTRKIFAVLFFLSVAAQVVVANSLVSKGRRMDELVLERKRLESQLLDLENKIAQASSLSAIKEKAESLGMKPGSLQYLPPAPVALNR